MGKPVIDRTNLPPELRGLTDEQLLGMGFGDSGEKENKYQATGHLYPYEKLMEKGQVRYDVNGKPIFVRKESMKHIPEPMLVSVDSKELSAYMQKNQAKLTDEELSYLISRIDALEETDRIEEENKLDLFEGKPPKKTEPVKDAQGFTGLPGLKAVMQTGQNACWSVSLSLLLQSRGVNLSQEQVRAFRPGSGEVLPNASTSLNFNADEFSTPSEHADLVLKVLPNTSMATMHLEPVSTESLTLDGKELTAAERTAAQKQLRTSYGQTIADTLRAAITKHKSPVSMALDGHFVTVTGISEDGKTIRYEDSMQGKSEQYVSTRTITMEELLNNYLFERTEAHPVTGMPVKKYGSGLSLSWLQDIDPPEYGEREEQPPRLLEDVPEAAKPDPYGVVQFAKPAGNDDVTVASHEEENGRIAGRTVGVTKRLDPKTLTGPLAGKKLQVFGGDFYLGSVDTYLPKQVYCKHDPKLLWTTEADAGAAEFLPLLHTRMANLPKDAPEELRKDLERLDEAVKTICNACIKPGSKKKTPPTPEELDKARQEVANFGTVVAKADPNTGKSYFELLGLKDAGVMFKYRFMRLCEELGLKTPESLQVQREKWPKRHEEAEAGQPEEAGEEIGTRRNAVDFGKTVPGEVKARQYEREEDEDIVTRRNAVDLSDQITNARAHIESLQREMRHMTKDPARQRQIVREIFAARIGVDSVIGKGKSLDRPRNRLKEQRQLIAMENNAAMQDWLENTPYEKLRSLILTGHGGDMEKAFTKYLTEQTLVIPKNTPKRFMPAAKQRCEALKAAMEEKNFTASSPAFQKAIFTELLAARAAADSQRHTGRNLGNKLDAAGLDNMRTALQHPLMQKAMEQAAAKSPALLKRRGHGGAFEEAVIDTFWKNACKWQLEAEPNRGYALPEIDVPRYMPTYDMLLKNVAEDRLPERENDLERLALCLVLENDRQTRGVEKGGSVRDPALINALTRKLAQNPKFVHICEEKYPVNGLLEVQIQAHGKYAAMDFGKEELTRFLNAERSEFLEKRAMAVEERNREPVQTEKPQIGEKAPKAEVPQKSLGPG